eukprot:538551-Prymnesium_polylepis.1
MLIKRCRSPDRVASSMRPATYGTLSANRATWSACHDVQPIAASEAARRELRPLNVRPAYTSTASSEAPSTMARGETCWTVIGLRGATSADEPAPDEADVGGPSTSTLCSRYTTASLTLLAGGSRVSSVA